MQTLTESAAAVFNKANDKFMLTHDFSLMDRVAALIRVGSQAYGTQTPASDEDFMAIVVPHVRHIVGLGQWESWEPGVDESVDMKVYAIAKFVKLAAAGNPNMVEMLFFAPDSYEYVGPDFQLLLDNRECFLSRECFKRFSGYATSQFQKMEQGKSQQHMGHKRKELVAKVGYDPKDASHLMRLLYMGEELALYGTLTPRLAEQPAKIVKEIKEGLWPLEEVKGVATKFAAQNEQLFNRSSCPLPNQSDLQFIELMLMEIHRRAIV